MADQRHSIAHGINHGRDEQSLQLFVSDVAAIAVAAAITVAMTITVAMAVSDATAIGDPSKLGERPPTPPPGSLVPGLD